MTKRTDTKSTDMDTLAIFAGMGAGAPLITDGHYFEGFAVILIGYIAASIVIAIAQGLWARFTAKR